MDANGGWITPSGLDQHDGLGPDYFGRVWALLTLDLLLMALSDLVDLVWQPWPCDLRFGTGTLVLANVKPTILCLPCYMVSHGILLKWLWLQIMC